MLSDMIRDYLDYIDKEIGVSPRTIYSYKYQYTKFLRYLGDTPVTAVDLGMIEDYFRQEEDRGLAVSSVNTTRANIRSLFQYCAGRRREALSFDPADIHYKKCPPPLVRVATSRDILMVLRALSCSQDRLIVLVLSQTCMRIGELVRMNVEDVSDIEIRVLGKGNRRRMVCMTPDLAFALNAHIYRLGRDRGPVFRSARGGAYTVSGLRNRFRRILEPQGLNASFHWYRHGGATGMMHNGADIFFIKEYLGHSDIRTTMRYLHITDREKAEKFKMFYKSEINAAKVLT